MHGSLLSKLCSKKSSKLIVIGLILLLVFIIHRIKVKSELESASELVPNTVHFIIFNKTSIDFTTFLSISSVLKVQRPNYVQIHCDCTQLDGHYWVLLNEISKKVSVPVTVSYLPRPTHVYGQPLSSIYHASDIARIQVLMRYGGIYLDTDVVVIRPLNEFLKYEMTLGWPFNDTIGTQVLVAKRYSRFLKLWLSGYRRYRPRAWYYNAGQFPTEQILERKPELVHRVPLLFGVNNLLDKLYQDSKWSEWREYYTIHLLSHHSPAPIGLNETTIKTYSPPFGEIARWLLYELEPNFKSIQDLQFYLSTAFPPDYVQ